MSIPSIDINQAPANPNSPSALQAKRMSPSAKTGPPQDLRPAEELKTDGSQAFVNIQNENEVLNRVAASVKTADTSMAHIHDYIAAIKEQLLTIVKNYPPFPPGSEERIQALKSFAAFRRQIDQLTIPPTHDDAARILADPAFVQGAGGLEVDFGGRKLRIGAQPAHSGENGLAIPPLPETATDEQISAMVGRLEAAEKTLAGRKAGLVQDAAVFISTAKTVPGAQVASPADDTAEDRSREVRARLAESAGPGLTENHSLLTGLV